MRLPVAILALFILVVSAIPVAAQDPPPAQQQVVYQEKVEGPDNYLVPYWNSNSGGTMFFDEDRKSSQGYGLSFTFWGRGILSAEVDFNYNPSFFGDSSDYDTNNLMTFTVSGIIGPWIQAGSMRIRPYAVIGGGLLRSTIEEFATVGWKTNQNRGVVDAGGGVLWLFTRNIGIRGDARYRMGVGAKDDEDGWGMLDAWKFLRLSAGVALAF